jgi:hypothetical protein
MKPLNNYFITNVNEGGASGHMAHPIDFEDFTGDDLKQLVVDLFAGEIKDITEKIDGTNIQATMNQKGEVVFIRNKGDLNSERGGMTIEDMKLKWASKPSVAATFINAGEIITKVFSKIGPKFFNPDNDTRVIANCECVIAGVTNVIPYGNAQVDFHDIWTYKRRDGVWVLEKIGKTGLDVIERALVGVEGAQLTPQVIINTNADCQKLVDEYLKSIDIIFNYKTSRTILQWKWDEWVEYIYECPDRWIMSSEEGMKALFDRWICDKKTVNLRVLRSYYQEHAEDLERLDKRGYKKIVDDITEPLDRIFLKIGNSVIKLCSGLINKNTDSATKQLIAMLNQTVKDVKNDPDPEIQQKLLNQLDRLGRLGGESSINAAEGIVFRYRGRLMKLTGSFAPLNQILGLKKFE